MKKSLLVLVLSSGILFAQQEYIQPDRMKNMQEMETAMANIQKGFLYNNVNVVRNGVKDLKARVKNTESFIKEGVNKEGFNTLTFAHKQSVDITKIADEILLAFENGDQYNAANGYLRVLSKCLSCHQTIRSW
jgi:cytochrome c556